VAIDLDEGVYANHLGYGVNDSGWVFVANWDGPALVWLGLTPNSSTELPAGIGGSSQGNGRGDYIAYFEDAVMLRGASGWTLSQPLHPPAGWPDTVALEAINDARVVVGWGRDPSRCTTTTQRGRTSTFCPVSPLAWIYDSVAGSWTPFAMSFPVSSNPAACAVTGVFPQGVNDAGMVIAYVDERALTQSSGRDNDCGPARAIVWSTVSGPAVPLPTTGALAGYSYRPNDINDRGDISGTANTARDARAVRWRAGTGAIDVLNGYYAHGDAIDECGRVVTGEGQLWDVDGTVDFQLQPPTGFASSFVLDIGGGVAVGGGATGSGLGWHALVWTVGACTP
jgi:hypothetical protein